MEKTQRLLDIIDLVGQTWHEAEEYDLGIEVIASALQYLKDDPDMSILEALENGMADWDL